MIPVNALARHAKSKSLIEAKSTWGVRHGLEYIEFGKLYACWKSAGHRMNSVKQRTPVSAHLGWVGRKDFTTRPVAQRRKGQQWG